MWFADDSNFEMSFETPVRRRRISEEVSIMKAKAAERQRANKAAGAAKLVFLRSYCWNFFISKLANRRVFLNEADC